MKPLGDLQILMRQWSALGPFHAVDAMCIAGAGDVARWERIIAAVIGAHGFPAPEWVREYDDIDTAVTEEMNEIFEEDAPPFRFFVAEAGGAGHWLGLVWDHWVADSMTIRELMRRLHAGWNGGELPPLRFAAPPRATVSDALAMAMGRGRGLRSACRLAVGDALDLRVSVCVREFPRGVVEGLVAQARQLGVTVNDWFAAVLMQVFGEWTAEERAAQPRRNRLAIGVAADTRRHFPEASRDAFGFFLTCFALLQPAPEKQAPAELVKRIAEETRTFKKEGAAQRFDGAWRALRWGAWLAISRRQRASLLQRSAPCVAGLSNVNLDTGWIADAPGLADYRRVSPCGPLTPVAFAPTTLRGRLSLVVTHRLNTFTAAQAGAFATEFVMRVTALSQANSGAAFENSSWPGAGRLSPVLAAIRLRLGRSCSTGRHSIAAQIYRISPGGELVTATGEAVPFNAKLDGGAEVGEVSPRGLTLSGWVIHSDAPDAPLDVVAVVDGEVAGSVRSSIPRPDVGSHFAVSDPPVGFRIEIPQPVSSDPVVRLFVVCLDGSARELNYVAGLFKLRHGWKNSERLEGAPNLG